MQRDHYSKKTINNSKTVLSTAATAALIALIYSVFRYNVFGGVAWSQLPLYILNKTVSFTGILLMAINLFTGTVQGSSVKLFARLKKSRADISRAAFMFIAVHVLLSLVLLKPANYEKFFETSGIFNFAGGLSMTSGVLAFSACAGLFFSPIPGYHGEKTVRSYINSLGFKVVLSLLILSHILFAGYTNWFSPEKWPGGMPPITAISFVIYFSAALLYFVFRKRSANLN